MFWQVANLLVIFQSVITQGQTWSQTCSYLRFTGVSESEWWRCVFASVHAISCWLFVWCCFIIASCRRRSPM